MNKKRDGPSLYEKLQIIANLEFYTQEEKETKEECWNEEQMGEIKNKYPDNRL